jgi:hypothetical protein
MFSASSEARDRNAPTNANQIRLQTSRIRQEHHPIRCQLPAGLSFRQGHPASASIQEPLSIGCPHASFRSTFKIYARALVMACPILLLFAQYCGISTESGSHHSKNRIKKSVGVENTFLSDLTKFDEF